MRALKDVLMYVSHQHAQRLLQLTGSENRLFIHENDLTNAREWLRSGKKHLTPSQCEKTKAQIERIWRMTNDLGYQSLLAEAAQGGQEWSQSNRYELAIDAFYFSPKAFRRAEQACYVSHYQEGRSWSGFKVAQPSAFSEQTSLDDFKARLKVFFNLRVEEELLVDVFPGGCTNGVIDQWQIMIYREGLPRQYLKLNEMGDGVTIDTYRPVHEYMLFYHIQSGRLDVMSTLKTRRQELASLFARAALGLDSLPCPVTPVPINLNLFLDRPALDFGATHPLESEIEEVIVEGITLCSRIGSGEFAVRPNKGSTLDVYRFLSLHGLSAGIYSDQYDVRRVTLAIRFGTSADEVRQGETIRFSLTRPNKCSLVNDCVRAHYIHSVLLRRWGVFAE